MAVYTKISKDELNDFFIEQALKMRVMGCGPTNRIIFTDRFIRNRKDRDLFENPNQDIFYDKLFDRGVFVNGNRIFHLSMCHTEKVMKKIIKNICEVSLEYE